MKKTITEKGENGFTLIESIIALVLVSIMATFIMSFLVPLSSSTTSLGWFRDQLALQQEMENIIGQYKHERSPTEYGGQGEGFGLMAFRTWAIDRPYIVEPETGFITFTFSGSGSNYTSSVPPWPASPLAGAPAVLIVTLRLNDQTLSIVLT